jgi:PiT family inorganic phosphate transporter
VTLSLWLLVVAALAITFSNGANDNFKGVATLFGSGTTNYRRALLWATVTTMAGSVMALVLASSLVVRFSGRGLVPDVLTGDPGFLTAVGGGAALTVLLATVTGFPISTTHALTGALVGAGFFAANGQLHLSALGTGFVAPLLLSPIAAAMLMGVMYGSVHSLRPRSGDIADMCICMTTTQAAVEPAAAYTTGMTDPSALTAAVPIVAPVSECRAHGLTPRATTSALLDGAHYLSAGAVGFARGVNDTPKLMALLLPAQVLLPTGLALLLVAGVMAIGGLLAAGRVAETMSHRVTTMTPGQGFLANATTAILVLFASRFGLPVSTTHVSTGSLFGLGAVTGSAQWRTIIQIVLAWIVTLPCAAICAALLWWLVR